jgi:hypothetical protein
MRPSKTIARAGDDGDASVKSDCHELAQLAQLEVHFNDFP